MATTSVIYIASLPHSGSTLLDLILGSHSQIENLGEIGRLGRYAVSPAVPLPSAQGRRCTCGAASIWQCPYWLKIDAVLRQKMDGGLRRLALAASDQVAFSENNLLLFNAVQQVTGINVLIDSSKSVARLQKILKMRDIKPIVVFLYRDPHGQIYSMMKKRDDPDAAIAENIRLTNAFLDIFAGQPHIAVRYEKLVSEPAIQIARILRRAGLEFEEEQLDWARRTKHNIGGNRMRFSPGRQLREDTSWRDGLSAELVARIDRAMVNLDARIAAEIDL
jgi:hypothetical protein